MLRIVFMGTPDFSVPTLLEIIGAGHEVIAVYSQPPRRAGRGMTTRKSPVHTFAEEMGIEVRTPTSLKSDDVAAEFEALQADVAVVMAYGLLLPKRILDAPVHGCLNLHASKLPRWRGAAPIQRAIMAGDTETAAMVMRMEEGLDTGPVCLADVVPIGVDETAGQLHDRLAKLGADVMVRALAALERGSLSCTPQPADGVTYAAKISKEESAIDFTRPGQEVHDHIRGLSPFPGAWFEVGGERVKVLRSEMDGANGGRVAAGTVIDDRLGVVCGDGRIVRLMQLQRAGKKPMQLEEFLRGFKLPAGQLIGS